MTPADVVVAALLCGAAATGAGRSRRILLLGITSAVAWLVAPLAPVLLFVHRPLTMHLALAHPSGRLRGSADRAVVGAFWVTALITPLARNEVVTLVLCAGTVATVVAHRRRPAAGDTARLGSTALLVAGIAVPAAGRLLFGFDAAVPAAAAYSAAFASAALVLAVASLLRSAEQDADAVLAPEGGGPDEVLAVLRTEAAQRPSARHRETLGAAAALLESNAVLRRGLDARASEGRASRRRLVEAADVERRRFAGLLEEGTLRHLDDVALTVDGLRDRLGPAGAAYAERCLQGLTTAREDLDRLLSGVRPRALDEHGLAGALPVLASTGSAGVRIACTSDRFPPAVESAVWFACAEAVVNAAKHARAGQVVVTVTHEREAGLLVAEVADDGAGGARIRPGGGLAGLVDRIEALDGRLDVESPADGGTRVRIGIPLP